MDTPRQLTELAREAEPLYLGYFRRRPAANSRLIGNSLSGSIASYGRAIADEQRQRMRRRVARVPREVAILVSEPWIYLLDTDSRTDGTYRSVVAKVALDETKVSGVRHQPRWLDIRLPDGSAVLLEAIDIDSHPLSDLRQVLDS